MNSAQDAPGTDRLLALTEAMTGPVAILADLVLDRFIVGSPKRISREAPVLILRYEDATSIPGGGANAVANVHSLGGRAVPIGVVGDDVEGRALLDELDRRGIPTTGVLKSPDYSTPSKTRILAGGRHAIKQQVVRYDREDAVRLTTEQIEQLTAVIQDHGPWGAVIVSDYGYGAATPEVASNIRKLVGDACPLLGDSRYRLGDFRGLTGATPNQEEAEGLLGRPLTDDPLDVEAAGHTLRDMLEAEFVLITRGSSGMSLISGQGSAHLPVHGTDQVADVTGAGDTVIGTFALAMAAGATPLEAACLANYAGGIVVMKMGTATLSCAELRDAIENDTALLEKIQWDGS